MTLTVSMCREKKEEEDSIEDSVDASIQQLEDYIEKRGRRDMDQQNGNN